MGRPPSNGGPAFRFIQSEVSCSATLVLLFPVDVYVYEYENLYVFVDGMYLCVIV